MIDQTKYQNYIKLTRQLKGIKFNIERHQLQGTNNKMILAPNNHYMGDMRTQSALTESSGWRESSLIWLPLHESTLPLISCFLLSSTITNEFDRLNLYIGSDLISSSDAPSLILIA